MSEWCWYKNMVHSFTHLVKSGPVPTKQQIYGLCCCLALIMLDERKCSCVINHPNVADPVCVHHTIHAISHVHQLRTEGSHHKLSVCLIGPLSNHACTRVHKTSETRLDTNPPNIATAQPLVKECQQSPQIPRLTCHSGAILRVQRSINLIKQVCQDRGKRHSTWCTASTRSTAFSTRGADERRKCIS